jgi:hypothetical protein
LATVAFAALSVLGDMERRSVNYCTNVTGRKSRYNFT